MQFAQITAYINEGYKSHYGYGQPCADDLPIAYIDWNGVAKGGYSDVIKWGNVQFWKVETE